MADPASTAAESADRPRGIFLILALLFSTGAVATDLYLAAVPDLARDLGVSVASAQLTISALLAGVAAGQLIYGTLSDIYGRRPVLLIGMSLFLLTSIACVLAPNIEILIAARFLQGLFACSGVVIGRAIVRDLYGPRDAAQVMAFMAAAMGLAPILAPAVGGLVLTPYGWRAFFVAIALYAAVQLAFVIWRLPETNRANRAGGLSVRTILNNYRELLTSRLFIAYTLLSASAFSGLFAFISGSSFIVIDILGLPARFFGVAFGGVVVGFVLGSAMGGRFSRKGIALDRLILVGTGFSALGGAMLAGLSLSGIETLPAILGPSFVYFIGAGLILPLTFAAGMGPFPHIAGSASSLMGFIQMTIGSVAGALVGVFFDGSSRSMTLIMGLAALIALTTRLRILRPSHATAAPPA